MENLSGGRGGMLDWSLNSSFVGGDELMVLEPSAGKGIIRGEINNFHDETVREFAKQKNLNINCDNIILRDIL